MIARLMLCSNLVSGFYAGVFSGGATPDPIPNSEVKSSCADDTIFGKVGRRRHKAQKPSGALNPLSAPISGIKNFEVNSKLFMSY